MEDTNREKVILTVVLTLAEGFVGYILYKNNILNTESFWIVFLSYVTPMGFLCFLNYWILSPVLILIGLTIWCWLGHYRRVSKQFNRIAIQCVTWLKNVKMHWGVIDTAEECQNANGTIWKVREFLQTLLIPTSFLISLCFRVIICNG